MQSMVNDLLTTSEAAIRLNAADSSVRLWRRQGKFPNVKQCGRDWLIPESDLEGFDKRTPGRPPKPAIPKTAKKKAVKR